MMFKFATVAAILSNAITAYAAEGSYNYDETNIWDQVVTEGANECAGTSNSPVAVEDAGCAEYHTYVMENGSCTFADMKASVLKNGVKIGIKDDATCDKPHFYLPESGDKYTFAQLHIHLSSEHTINGEYYAAELHMVHVGPTGERFSVIGTMIQPDKPDDNSAFAPYMDSWKDARYEMESACSEETCKIKNGYVKGSNFLYPEATPMHPYKLVNTDGGFYTYFGGLTTPPCTQAVYWNLSAKAMNVSVRQFAEMSEIILQTMDPESDCKKKLTNASKSGSTSRPPQPLNGRVVKKLCSKAKEGEDDDEKSLDGAKSSADVTSFTVGALSFAAAMTAGQLL